MNTLSLIDSLRIYKDEILITASNKQFINELVEVGVLATKLNLDTSMATAKINENYEWILLDKSKSTKKRNKFDEFFEKIGSKVI